MSNIDNTSSLPETIKKLRLSNSYSILDLSNETRVSAEFIKNLEEGRYEQLPALAYSAGLLFNLLEYLKIPEEETNQIVDEFEKTFSKIRNSGTSNTYEKAKEIKSSPSKNQTKNSNNPNYGEIMEEESNNDSLYSKNSIIFLIIIILTLIVLGVYLYIQNQKSLSTIDEANREKEIFQSSREPQVETLYDSRETYTLAAGDEVKVFSQNKIIVFTLEKIEIEPSPRITLRYLNDQIIILDLYRDIEINLNQEEESDLLIKFQQLSGELAVVYFSHTKELNKDLDYSQLWSSQEKISIGNEEYTLLKNVSKSVITGYVKATTLPIHLTFNIDGKRQNVINLKPGNHFTIQAQNHLEILIGNFRSAQLVINQIPIIFFHKIENQFSIAKIVKWVPSPNNETKFNLIIKNIIN